MEWIDRHAYNNRLRAMPPEQKAGLSLLTITLCLLLNRPLVGLLATAWMLLLALVWAGVPWRVFGAALLAQGGFLAWGVAGVMVQVGTPAEALWQFGPLAVTAGSWATAVLLFSRALGCAAAMNFLAFTTPLVDLIDLGRRLRIPAWLLDLATLTYRFTFVLLESMGQMVTAQQARLGYAGWRRAMHSAAQVAASLLVESYRRSQRLQLALEGRGYSGDLRVLPHEYQSQRLTWPVGGLLAASLLLVML